MQAEEKQKQAVDIEHKKFVAQMRKEAIEKAKLQQYYQTDRVKNFHVRKSYIFPSYFNRTQRYYVFAERSADD